MAVAVGPILEVNTELSRHVSPPKLSTFAEEPMTENDQLRGAPEWTCLHPMCSYHIWKPHTSLYEQAMGERGG